MGHFDGIEQTDRARVAEFGFKLLERILMLAALSYAADKTKGVAQIGIGLVAVVLAVVNSVWITAYVQAAVQRVTGFEPDGAAPAWANWLAQAAAFVLTVSLSILVSQWIGLLVQGVAETTK